jgi:hypothetical protein
MNFIHADETKIVRQEGWFCYVQHRENAKSNTKLVPVIT